MSLKETKTDDDPNYATRFAWAVAAILLTMLIMGIATGKFG
jgi:hypothetical protein